MHEADDSAQAYKYNETADKNSVSIVFLRINCQLGMGATVIHLCKNSLSQKSTNLLHLMKTWKIQPADKTIARYIDCYWLLEKNISDIGLNNPKLNPDPAGHLILAQSGQPYLYEDSIRSDRGTGSHLILPHSRTLSMDHSQPFLIMGIKFQVGALYALKLPTIEPLLNQVIPIDLTKLFQSGILDEKKIQTLALKAPKNCQEYLDSALAPLLSDKVDDKHSTLVSKALACFPQTKLSDLGNILHCSQRTIERSFMRVTGLTLKQYHSMERLENLLVYLHKQDNKEIVWADIAFQFGFSDQPHLVRYLKNSIGHTPGEYARERDLVIDAYGDFE